MNDVWLYGARVSDSVRALHIQVMYKDRPTNMKWWGVYYCVSSLCKIIR